MDIIKTIRAEIDKLYGEYKDKFHQCGDQYHLGLIDGLDMAERVLDTLQEPDGLHFLPMVRLVEMIRTDEWNDRGKRYAEKLVSALENEGYSTDARLVRNHIKYMDGEDVPMATMDNQEPEIDFEQELYNRFGMVKDFTLGMRIAQCFYNLGLQNAK